MPAPRTEVTEVTTGLAMLGFPDLDRALAVGPDWFRNVDAQVYRRLVELRRSDRMGAEFAMAWENGLAFLRAAEGLRGRVPRLLEWKGPHRPPGYEQIPADLRVDHVYLISCKYGSNLLHNVSPSHLFDRRLAERRVEPTDWYQEVAPEAYQELYLACRSQLGSDLPGRIELLTGEHRAELKRSFARSWPDQVRSIYESFAWEVAYRSAERWLASLHTPARRAEMLWRLLRLQAAPYFVLGADTAGNPLRYRVGTPWDFRDEFELRSFDVVPEAAGQPQIRWRSEVIDRCSGSRRVTEGHVEIRWSHGRFAGAPEAKVYLDTLHHGVAGYVPLNDT